MVSPPSLMDIRRIPDSLALRVAIALLVIVPVAVMFWSIKKRVPLLDQEKEEIRRVYELEAHIARARAAWSEREARSVRDGWENARSMLPRNYEDVAAWLERVNRLASSSGFNMTYQIGEVSKPDSLIEDVSAAPVKIRVFAPYEMRMKKRGENAYLLFLKFVRDVSESAFWVDLAGLSANGVGEGMKEGALSLTIWVAFANSSSGAARLNASMGDDGRKRS